MATAISEAAAKPTMNSAGWIPALAKKPMVPGLRLPSANLLAAWGIISAPTMMRSTLCVFVRSKFAPRMRKSSRERVNMMNSFQCCLAVSYAFMVLAARAFRLRRVNRGGVHANAGASPSKISRGPGVRAREERDSWKGLGLWRKPGRVHSKKNGGRLRPR